jgi:hypothetical protein
VENVWCTYVCVVWNTERCTVLRYCTGGDVLRSSVAVRAHHPGGDVAVAAGRAILGETEVGQLGVVILRGWQGKKAWVPVRTCSRCPLY